MWVQSLGIGDALGSWSGDGGVVGGDEAKGFSVVGSVGGGEEGGGLRRRWWR